MTGFKLNDPEFLRDPAPVLAQIRAQGPLVQIKIPFIGTCWATTTDTAARTLLKDESRFVRNPANAGCKDISRYYWFLPRFLRPVLRSIIGLDGADHKRLRSAVESSFSRLSIEALHPQITQIADRLLDELDPDHPVDITSAYARRLPLDVICALLGIRAELRTKLTRAIAPISGPTNMLTLLRIIPGLYQSIALLRSEITAIRTEPRAGLLSELAHSIDNDLSDDELLSLAFILFVAGHETTLHLISDAIFALTDSPEHRTVFRDGNLATTSLAVEEFMRFFSPVMMSKPLFVRRDCEFEGQALKQGDKVLALLLAANHDPVRFERPEQLQPDRRPNAHLGFGFGPHVCLGMHLARAESHIALERLFHRFPNLQRAPADAPPDFSRRIGMRGMRSLKVRLVP